MNNNIIISIGIVIIFFCLVVQTSIGLNFNDDTTPPVSTHTLDPSEPNGENGWYIYVTVILNATDDMSGVKEIRYYIDGGPEFVIPGDHGSFVVGEDGKNICIYYYAIDNAGNIEEKNEFYIDLDGTKPEIQLSFDVDYIYSSGRLFVFIFTATAADSMSGMDRVEFYMDDVYKETIIGSGPIYEWIWKNKNYSNIAGIIHRREITEEYVKFYAVFVIAEEPVQVLPDIYSYAYDKAGNSDSDMLTGLCYPGSFYNILISQNLTLPNNYKGYIGNFLICAKFKQK